MEPNQTKSIQPSNSIHIFLILTSCFIGILMALLVYEKKFLFGSVQGNAVYVYFDTTKPIAAQTIVCILFLLGILIYIGGRFLPYYERTTLTACFLLGMAIQFLIHAVYPIPLGAIVESNRANSFYSTAKIYSAAETLEKYDMLVQSFTSHAKSNMPGKILLFRSFIFFNLSTQMMGCTIIIISTLGGPLLYGICKRLFHDNQAAFYAFVLYILIPCKLFFFPLLNTITPIIILLCLFLLLVYIEEKRIASLWLLGCALYILVLFEPSPLSTGLIFIGVLISAIRNKKVSAKDFWGLLIIPTLAFLCIYAIFFIIFSFDLVKGLQYVLQDAAKFNTTANRSYWLWIGENSKEFFYSAGTVVIIIFIYWVLQSFREWGVTKSKFSDLPIENIFAIMLFATFLLILFLGINRGETSRLWIYLSVFFQVPAALLIARVPKSAVLIFLVASTLAIQSIIALQQVAFILPG